MLSVRMKILLWFRYNLFNYMTKFAMLLKRNKAVEIRKLFISGDVLLTSNEWIRLTGDLRKSSCLLKDSFYVDFINRFKEKENIGDEEIKRTHYFRNAMRCIGINGSYFEAMDEEGAVVQAKKFADMYRKIKAGQGKQAFDVGRGHSGSDRMAVVYKVFNSDHFEIFDGHHRLAIEYVLGKETKEVVVLFTKKTYLQELVFNGKQTDRKRMEMYQPLDSPEFSKGWSVIRKCEDRFKLMLGFLKERGLAGSGLRVLDLACSYGWFVRGFLKNGFNATGIDRDSASVKIGETAYRIDHKNIFTSTIESFIKKNTEKFDIVLFLSVLHHYGLGLEKHSPGEILRLIDNVTDRVLFLDSGQNHELWFKKRLPEWDEDYLIRLIKEKTSFKSVIPLGKDEDGVGIYKGNYGRTLFACVK